MSSAALGWAALLAGTMAMPARAGTGCADNPSFESGNLWQDPISWTPMWSDQPLAPQYPLPGTGPVTMAPCNPINDPSFHWPYVRVVGASTMWGTPAQSTVQSGAQSVELWAPPSYDLGPTCIASAPYQTWARVEQSFTLPANGFNTNCFQFWYAGSFMDAHPNDTLSTQLRIFAICNGTQLGMFTFYDWSPGLQNGTNSFRWLAWTQYTSPCLPSGCNVTIRVEAYGCDYGGHGCFGYLDNVTCGSNCCVPSSETPTSTRTATRTGTTTATATATVSATATATRTHTRTATRTNTAFGTPTSTRTSTATFTNTYTPSPTRTSTNTFTDSPTPTFTVSPTATYTFTRTFTFTATVTETATDTSTPSFTATATETPTATGSFTITPTFSFTFCLTPTVTPTETASFTVTATPAILAVVEVFNEAGERVRRFEDSLPATLTVPDDMKLSPNPFSPDADGSDDSLRILFPSGAALAWDGKEDGGSAVSNGIYFLTVTLTDPFGRKLTALTRTVAVLARGNLIRLRILDKSGSIRKSFPERRLPATVSDLSIAPNPFTPGISSTTGLWYTCLFKLVGADERAAPTPPPAANDNIGIVFPWTGDDVEGRLLTNGVYWAELVSTDPRGKTTRIVRSVVILRPDFELLKDVRAYPNPKAPDDSDPFIHFAYTIPNADPVDVVLRIFDLQGQLVATRDSGRHGSPDIVGVPFRYRISWNSLNAKRRFVADGLYFAELSARDQVTGVLHTKRVKFGVLKRKG